MMTPPPALTRSANSHRPRRLRRSHRPLQSVSVSVILSGFPELFAGRLVSSGLLSLSEAPQNVERSFARRTSGLKIPKHPR
jgi:hypothetical protein